MLLFLFINLDLKLILSLHSSCVLLLGLFGCFLGSLTLLFSVGFFVKSSLELVFGSCQLLLAILKVFYLCLNLHGGLAHFFGGFFHLLVCFCSLASGCSFFGAGFIRCFVFALFSLLGSL